MRADEPLHPNVTGSAVDLDFGDLGHDGLAAVGVGDAAAGQDVAAAEVDLVGPQVAPHDEELVGERRAGGDFEPRQEALEHGKQVAQDAAERAVNKYLASPTGPSAAVVAIDNKSGAGGNEDGHITSEDTVFNNLRLWIDANHNGISEPHELQTLPDLNLKTLSLGYREAKRTDIYGNQFRYRAKVKDTHGAQLRRWAWDVFLVTQ